MTKILTPKCCYIYVLPLIEQRLMIRCHRKAIWQIKSDNPNDIYDDTESCDNHVGKLLDDSPAHHIWRI